jgi:hypothetical protein
VFWAICIFFPLVALLTTAGAAGDAANAAAGRGEPRLGGGGPEVPGPQPDPPPGGEPAVTDDEAGRPLRPATAATAANLTPPR